MKTFTKFLTMLAVAALFATGCVNEEPPYKEDPNPEPTRQAEISYAVFCLKKKKKKNKIKRYHQKQILNKRLQLNNVFSITATNAIDRVNVQYM